MKAHRTHREPETAQGRTWREVGRNSRGTCKGFVCGRCVKPVDWPEDLLRLTANSRLDLPSVNFTNDEVASYHLGHFEFQTPDSAWKSPANEGEKATLEIVDATCMGRESTLLAHLNKIMNTHLVK